LSSHQPAREDGGAIEQLLIAIKQLVFFNWQGKMVDLVSNFSCNQSINDGFLINLWRGASGQFFVATNQLVLFSHQPLMMVPLK